MGAMPYENLAPWHDDPREALTSLQSQFLNDNYDLPAVLQEHIDSARQAVQSCKNDGDEYGLLDIYQADLDYLESVTSKPIPDSPAERIMIVRKIWESGGEGVGNILDITNVTDAGGIHVTRRMPDAEVQQHLRTSTPSADDAKHLLGKIADQLGRGESVCFPVYDSATPCGWWFAGYTVD